MTNCCELPSYNQYLKDTHHSYAEAESFLDREVVTRVKYAASIPLGILESVCGSVCGLVHGTHALVSVGTVRRFNVKGNRHLESFRHLLINPYQSIMKTINPDTRFREQNHEDGIIAGPVLSRIRNFCDSIYDSEYWINRNVSARLSHLLEPLVSVVTRVADFCIGCVAALFSVLALGKCDLANHFAYRGLQSTAIVDDMFRAVRKFMAPNPMLG